MRSEPCAVQRGQSQDFEKDESTKTRGKLELNVLHKMSEQSREETIPFLSTSELISHSQEPPRNKSCSRAAARLVDCVACVCITLVVDSAISLSHDAHKTLTSRRL